MIVKFTVTHEGRQSGLVFQRDEKTGQVTMRSQGSHDDIVEGLEVVLRPLADLEEVYGEGK